MSETVMYQISETSAFMMSFAFITSKGNAVVVDGGRPEDIPQLLDIIGCREIKAWILTHPHVDHISGFIDVVANKKADFEKVYYNFPELDFTERTEPWEAYALRAFLEIEPLIKDKAVRLCGGDIFNIDELKFEVLQSYEPDNPIEVDSSGNENSLVFMVTGPNKKILFLGDLGPVGGDRLYERHWRNLKCDMVQMAHHGHSGPGVEVYLAAAPYACLWCCPDWLYDEEPVSFGPRLYGTKMTRYWMDALGVKTHYVTKDGTHRIII